MLDVITELVPDAPTPLLKHSSTGCALIENRKILSDPVSSEDDECFFNYYLIPRIKRMGFHKVPFDGSLFFPGNTGSLAEWITRQSKSRCMDLLFVFTNNLDNIFNQEHHHVIAVHIEGNQATIVLPGDNNNPFVSLYFTPSITSRLIKKYFASTGYTEVWGFHRDASQEGKGKQGKRRRKRK